MSVPNFSSLAGLEVTEKSELIYSSGWVAGWVGGWVAGWLAGWAGLSWLGWLGCLVGGLALPYLCLTSSSFMVSITFGKSYPVGRAANLSVSLTPKIILLKES